VLLSAIATLAAADYTVSRPPDYVPP